MAANKAKFPSKTEFQSELHLASGVCVGGLGEVRWKPVLSREVVDSNAFIDLNELSCGIQEAVVSDLNTLVVTIEKIERFDNQVQFPPVPGNQAASDPHVGGGVVRADEGVAAVAGKTVIGGVSVLVGVTVHAGVDGPSAAYGDYAGKLPVVKEPPEKRVIAVERFGSGDPGQGEAMPLIGDA